MTTVTLDGRKMTTRQAAHAYIQRRLELPAHYGRNLDALWDVLSTWSVPLRIRLVHDAAIHEHLNGYARSLVQVFRDAARENPRLTFEIDTRPLRLVGRLPDL